MIKEVSVALTACQVGGAAALAQAMRYNRTIRVLDLTGNLIGDDGISVICGALDPRNSALVDLRVGKNQISSVGAHYVATLLRQYSRLELLDLSDNVVYKEGAVALAHSMLTNQSLRSLSLSHNGITDAGYQALADALRHNCTLTRASLTWRRGDKVTLFT